MNLKQKILAVLVALVALFGGGYTARNFGSVSNDIGYYSTSTNDITWSTASTPTQFKLLKNGAGVLGSIVITNAVAGTLNLYDGTSTSSHNDYATTTLVKIGASVAAGTYTFDTTFSRGLIAEFPTAIGAASSTITWR